MEKTIKDIKESTECLKKAILQAIRDFEIANPDIEITVITKRACPVRDDDPSHTVNVITFIK